MNVGPNTSFEAVIDTGDTGLVGTIEVGVNDNLGNTVVAFTTVGVIEIAAGVYSKALISPSSSGQFTIIWRQAGEVLGVESLDITYSVVVSTTPGPGATARTLTTRVRRFMQDWGDGEDDLTFACNAGDPSLSVADSSLYGKGFVLEVEDEAMQVTGTPSSTLVNVRRGIRGTTPVTHLTGADVRIRPHFLNYDYLEALNSAIEACYPWIYKPIVDETIQTVGGTYEYPIPPVDGVPIRAITRVFWKDHGGLAWQKVMKWDVVRHADNVSIKIGWDIGPASLRVMGFTQILPFNDFNSALDPTFPKGAEDALVFYAAQYLLASGESRRVREDTGLRDDRESRNAVGSSGRISEQIYQRFLGRLGSSAMQPMPRYVVSVA